MAEMDTGEMEAGTKVAKTSTSLEQPPSTPSHAAYQEWAAAFQAYYTSGGVAPLPPPAYFPSTVGTGPQPHPYMWGAQPLMPPYGTPPPYAAMYPHGGMYPHPSMTPGTHPYGPYSMAVGNASEAQGAIPSAGTDGDGKPVDRRPKRRVRKAKGRSVSTGIITSKESDPHKGNSGCTNGALSNSGDSLSEGSTQGSEEGSQNGTQAAHKGNVDQVPLSIGGKQAVGAGPLTNLNIGMDYWSGGGPANLLAQGKRGPSAAATTALISPSNLMGSGRDELWPQEDRELKRERRKQSNRESARRSRLRKQAEYDELAARVEVLIKENDTLRNELSRITEECKKLSEENASLLDQLQIPRPDGLHPEFEQNPNLLEESVHIDNASIQRDAGGANNLNLTGSSNVDYGVGNLVLSST